MMYDPRSWPLILLAIIVLTACADPTAFLPMPYKPGDKGQNRVAQMILPDHIVVPQVRGLDEAAATLVTRAVIDDFLQKETIATTSRPAGRTSSLYGEFTKRADGATSIRWTFRDPYGATLDDFEIPVATNLTDLDSDSLATRMLAKDMASAVTTRVLGLLRSEPDPRLEPTRHGQAMSPGQRGEQGQPTGNGEKIIVTALFDVPRDGERPLRREINAALRQAGFDVTDRPDEKTFRLQCTVGIIESRPGFARLALTWELKSPRGVVLATIDQSNEIPSATLESGWEGLAPLVTQGAATGIADFFQNRAGGS